VTAQANKTAVASDLNLADGGYCYRIRTQDPITAAPSFSNYVPVNTPGVADVVRPTSISARLDSSSGFANTLDTGDRLVIDFSEQMSIQPNATIRFTDSDCGAATNAGPATCVGGVSNTLSDVTCGVNAICTLSTSGTQLTVTLTSNPAIVLPGSTAGAQFAVVVTDSSGITDLSLNIWDVDGSIDRLIP
jgi:hypothetical protein